MGLLSVGAETDACRPRARTPSVATSQPPSYWKQACWGPLHECDAGDTLRHDVVTCRPARKKLRKLSFPDAVWLLRERTPSRCHADLKAGKSAVLPVVVPCAHSPMHPLGCRESSFSCPPDAGFWLRRINLFVLGQKGYLFFPNCSRILLSRRWRQAGVVKRAIPTCYLAWISHQLSALLPDGPSRLTRGRACSSISRVFLQRPK